MANSFYRLPKVLTHKAEKVNKLVKKTEENAACYKHFFNTSMCTDFFFKHDNSFDSFNKDYKQA